MKTTETQYLKTAGDYRRALQNLLDDAPIEPFINNVATKVRFVFSGEGDQMNLIVEPNYTCIPAGSTGYGPLSLIPK
jgi:hypothetical protein